MLTVGKPTASIVRWASSAALLALAGCASAPKPIDKIPSGPLRAATAAEVLSAYDAYAQAVRTLSASGELELRDRRRGESRRFALRLLAARDGRLYLKASLAVVTALEVVADGQTFWFQVPSRKTVWTGPATARGTFSDTREPYFALRPVDIVAALLPEPLAPAADESLLLEGDREGFSLAVGPARAGGVVPRRRVWVERDTLLPSRARSYAASGDVELDVRFASWQDGLPRTVEVARPIDGYEARFEFSKLQCDANLPSAAFLPRTPEGYRQVTVQ